VVGRFTCNEYGAAELLYGIPGTGGLWRMILGLSRSMLAFAVCGMLFGRMLKFDRRRVQSRAVAYPDKEMNVE